MQGSIVQTTSGRTQAGPHFSAPAWLSLRRGAARWRAASEVAEELFDRDGLRLSEWLHSGRAEIVKTGPHRTVYRLDLPAGRFYLKHYKTPDWRARVQNLVRPCRAILERRAAERVSAAGIATFEPVAVGFEKSGPLVTDSFLISREIADVRPVDEVVTEAAGHAAAGNALCGVPAGSHDAEDRGARAPRVRSGLAKRVLHLPDVRDNTALRRRLAVALGNLVGRLHRAGLIHRDLHAGNILMRTEPDGSLRLWLIDLHAVSRCRRLTVRQIERNLALLNNFFSHFSTRADRLRFFRAYLRQVLNHGDTETRCFQEEGSRIEDGGLRIVKPGLSLASSPSSILHPRSSPASPCLRVSVVKKLARRVEAYCRRALVRSFRKGDRKWRRGNRRLIIADSKQARCRGLAWIGREELAAIRDDPQRLFDEAHVRAWHRCSECEKLATIELVLNGRRFRGLAAVRESPRWTGRLRRRLGLWSPARRAWELGNARYRRGIPGPRPVLFVETISKAATQEYVLFESALETTPPRDALEAEKLMAEIWTGTKFHFSAINVSAFLLLSASCLAAAAIVSGCRQTHPAPITRPVRHSIRADQLLVLSNFRLAKDHPLIQDLIALRRQVTGTLDLPADGNEVVVYIFANEAEYRRYLDAVHPGLPNRRAYFVGTPAELAVYTYWGERIQEDLRHEYTHGLLHASLQDVPLWLDEGLAEYFEIPGPRPGTINPDYAGRLAASLANAWRPELERLERIKDFSQMQHVDYQESWAWVHFLLHSTPDTRDVLLGYLRELRTDARATPLSVRLAEQIPHCEARFATYVASLPMARLVSGGLEPGRVGPE